MSKWIPVTDDVPELDQDVIVAYGSGEVGVAFHAANRIKEGMVYVWVSGDFILPGVTHWMDLPDHPDRKEDLVTELDDFGYMDPDEFFD